MAHIRKYLLASKSPIPDALLQLQDSINDAQFELAIHADDGRINSALSEKHIIEMMKERLGSENVIEPPPRHWFDVLIHDKVWGWVPVDIKVTEMKPTQNDNGANLASCVHAMTNHTLDWEANYANGKMSKIILEKFNNHDYNRNPLKDYFYFVV